MMDILSAWLVVLGIVAIATVFILLGYMSLLWCKLRRWQNKQQVSTGSNREDLNHQKSRVLSQSVVFVNFNQIMVTTISVFQSLTQIGFELWGTVTIEYEDKPCLTVKFRTGVLEEALEDMIARFSKNWNCIILEKGPLQYQNRFINLPDFKADAVVMHPDLSWAPRYELKESIKWPSYSKNEAETTLILRANGMRIFAKSETIEDYPSFRDFLETVLNELGWNMDKGKKQSLGVYICSTSEAPEVFKALTDISSSRTKLDVIFTLIPPGPTPQPASEEPAPAGIEGGG